MVGSGEPRSHVKVPFHVVIVYSTLIYWSRVPSRHVVIMDKWDNKPGPEVGTTVKLMYCMKLHNKALEVAI